MPKKFEPDSRLARRISDRMMRMFKGAPEVVASEYGATGVDLASTTAGSAQERRSRRMANQMKALNQEDYDRSRRARYLDYKEIRDEVPEMATALQVLTDFVFGGDSVDGVVLQFDEGVEESYKEIVNSTMAAVGGINFFVHIFKEGALLGDSFTELIFSSSSLVAERPLIATSTDVVVNNFSQVVGFKSRMTPTVYDNGDSVMLAPVQVVHYAPDKARGHRYGRSMYATARKLWRQSEAAEDVLSLLSILQAAARKSVTYPMPGNIRPDQVDDFLENLKSGQWSQQVFDRDGKMRRRITSLIAMDDLVYPYREGSEKPSFHNDPPADLRQIIDMLRFMQDKFFICTGVPAALCGFERNVNARTTLEEQGRQFSRTVRRKQQEVVQLIHTVIQRGLAAAGVKPSVQYSVRMPRVSSFDEKMKADTNYVRAQTARILANDLGIDFKFVLKEALGLSDEDVMSLSAVREVGESSDRLYSLVDKEFGVKQLLQDLAESVERSYGDD
tara:strand:+ start:932 stop:2440 length:1509 start_codon:yes stop_codon:yes gene_type:complete